MRGRMDVMLEEGNLCCSFFFFFVSCWLGEWMLFGFCCWYRYVMKRGFQTTVGKSRSIQRVLRNRTYRYSNTIDANTNNHTVMVVVIVQQDTNVIEEMVGDDDDGVVV